MTSILRGLVWIVVITDALNDLTDLMHGQSDVGAPCFGLASAAITAAFWRRRPATADAPATRGSDR